MPTQQYKLLQGERHAQAGPNGIAVNEATTEAISHYCLIRV